MDSGADDLFITEQKVRELRLDLTRTNERRCIDVLGRWYTNNILSSNDNRTPNLG